MDISFDASYYAEFLRSIASLLSFHTLSRSYSCLASNSCIHVLSFCALTVGGCGPTFDSLYCFFIVLKFYRCMKLMHSFCFCLTID